MLLPSRKTVASSSETKEPQDYLQILDLLHMSRLEKDCAERFRLKLKTLKTGNTGSRGASYPSVAFFKCAERRHLLKQTREAAKFYLFVRRERMKNFERYISGIVPSNGGATRLSAASF